MSQLFLVRHGQARLFTDNYDRLSDLGVLQSKALGDLWIRHGVRPDHVWTGTLERQVNTATLVGEVFRTSGEHWPESSVSEDLNEFPAEQILTILSQQLRETDASIAELADAFDDAADDQDRYRYFHRLLEAVTARWVQNDYDNESVPVSWSEWSGAVRDILRRIMAYASSGESVVVFTSGGPVGVGVQTVMGAPELKAAELNWRIHNSAVTKFTFSGQRVSLDRFNEVAHLNSENLTYR